MSKDPKKLPTPSLEEHVDAEAKVRYKENQELARTGRAAKALAQEQAQELADLRKRLGLLEGLNDSFTERRPAPEWLAPKLPGSHRAIPSLLLTDIHWDEVVRPEEVEGYNCYNRAIAEGRVQRAFTKSIVLTRDYFAGVKYDGFQLFLGGDLLSGIIHEELTETNQAQLCESIYSILEPLEAGVECLAKEYKKVHVTAVVGNHGRRTKKPRSKFRVKDNFDWLVYMLVARAFKGRKDISVDVSPSADATATLYSTRYRLTHGDQFRGGSGISAELSPLLLGYHRKAKKQQAVGNPFDVLVMGHWHKTLWLPGIIMGGSVVGYDEHAYIGNYRPEPPQCSLWLTTPEHGITLQTQVFVQDRKVEGW